MHPFIPRTLCRVKTLCAFAASLCFSVSVSAQDRLLGLLDESSEIVFSVRSIAEMADRIELLGESTAGVGGQRPLGDRFAEMVTEGEHTTFAAMIEDLFEGLDFDLDEAKEIFSGAMVFSINNVSKALRDYESAGLPVLLLEYSKDTAEVHEFLEQMKENAHEDRDPDAGPPSVWTEQSFMGETIFIETSEDAYSDEPEVDFVYALVDGVLIAGFEVATIESIIERMKDGFSRGQKLVDTAGYQRAIEEVPDGLFNIYINIEGMVRELIPFMREELGEAAMMVGLSIDAVLDALAFDALEGLRFGFEPEADASGGINFSFALTFRERAGLLSLLVYDSQLPAPPAYVGLDALGSDISSFSISESFAALEALVNQINPMYGGMFAMQLDEIRQQTGVDLRSGILENFRSSITTFAVPSQITAASDSPAEPNSVYVLELVDGAALNNALETLKGMVPGGDEYFEAIEVDGVTGYHFRGPDNQFTGEAGVQIGYVVTRDRLIVSDGPPQLLRIALQRISGDGTPSSSLWDQAWILERFDAISHPNAVTRGYMNLGGLFDELLGLFTEGFMAGWAGDAPPFQSFVDGLSLEGYHLVSEGNMDSTAMSGRAYLFRKETP